jgi:hypothetical protein
MLKDIGSYLSVKYADALEAVAAGTGDATLATGAWVDRGDSQSCLLVLAYNTTLTDTKTLTLNTFGLKDATSSGGAGAAAYGTDYPANTLLFTAATPTLTADGIVVVEYDLSEANQFIQSQLKIDMNAGSADTFRGQVIILLGPGSQIPVP